MDLDCSARRKNIDACKAHKDNYLFRRFLSCIAWLGVIQFTISFPSFAFATQPLFDRIEIDGDEGRVHDSQHGWLKLPESESLQRMRLAEQCSAIGGPRGKFKIANGKLWLYALYRCSGEIRLEEAYPQASEKILANWISAELVAEIGHVMCYSKSGQPKFEKLLQLSIMQGEVKAMTYIKADCEVQ